MIDIMIISLDPSIVRVACVVSDSTINSPRAQQNAQQTPIKKPQNPLNKKKNKREESAILEKVVAK